MTDIGRNVRRVLKDPFRANPYLTERERHVATMAAVNLTVQEIAEALGISTPMANQHLRFAMQKIGVRRKRDLTKLLLDGVRDALTSTEA